MELQPEQCCRVLKWDSEYFGFPIAAVTGNTLTLESAPLIERWCVERQIKCLYFIARADDSQTVQIAESHLYHLADIRITMARASVEIDQVDGNENSIRKAMPCDVAQLRKIARTVHRDGRFHFDSRFEGGVADELYARWIEVSCSGYADAVFVTGTPGEPTGYITCHLNGLTGSIGLLGVAPDVRRKGIGHQLVSCALQFFSSKGAGRVTVVSHGRSEDAQRLYQRCGFLTQQVQLYYHKWF